MNKIPVALTFGGIDPDAGAGIYADIKTFSSLGVYGIACVTALTSQNTRFFNSMLIPSKNFFISQIDTLLEDIKPDSTKISMIPKPWMVDIIFDFIFKKKLRNIVIDPVMISKGGGVLTPCSSIKRIIKLLFPLASVVTPNIDEAEYITGIIIRDKKDMINASVKISEITKAKCVLLKGGHLKGSKIFDVLYFNGKTLCFYHRKINTKNTHGTGCSLSAAISGFIARGLSIKDSIRMARKYIFCAVKKSLDLGKGNGPLNHFWRYY
ncbi:MAG: bifunctional hydroxymethylpyrimidine kinase/phosphomethylpyrimidine kinase [Elusimicrobiales bacterium]|nr:bifunctional hydroxymethylpyrimidine kinase/phosphomethylpyrimidine kinase [Elusimicrobiales bacterium]